MQASLRQSQHNALRTTALAIAIGLVACGDSAATSVGDGDDATVSDVSLVDSSSPGDDFRQDVGSDGAQLAPTDTGSDLGRFDQRDSGDDFSVDASKESQATALTDTCRFPASAALAHARTPPGFCAWIWASTFSNLRGIEIAPNGDVLVVDTVTSTIYTVFDDDHDGVSGENEHAALASIPGLNHSLTLRDGFLYASTITTVYRWPYVAGQRVPFTSSDVVIRDMPSSGHQTRTLIFDAAGNLYVSVGALSNIDPNSDRARIRRFSWTSLPPGGIPFESGEVFADGLRNEVGLAFDAKGRLWGVENGVDAASRPGMPGIEEDNPSEELNLFDKPGGFYGFPYCWSEYLLPPEIAKGPGTEWLDFNFVNDQVHSDAWCQSPENVIRPKFAMPAHVAPLDIIFYHGQSFPTDYQDSAIVTFHGSSHRTIPAGYKVVRIAFENGEPTRMDSLLEYDGATDLGPDWGHRPVGVRTGLDGQLFVTDGSRVLVIGHRP